MPRSALLLLFLGALPNCASLAKSFTPGYFGGYSPMFRDPPTSPSPGRVRLGVSDHDTVSIWGDGHDIVARLDVMLPACLDLGLHGGVAMRGASVACVLDIARVRLSAGLGVTPQLGTKTYDAQEAEDATWAQGPRATALVVGGNATVRPLSWLALAGAVERARLFRRHYETRCDQGVDMPRSQCSEVTIFRLPRDIVFLSLGVLFGTELAGASVHWSRAWPSTGSTYLRSELGPSLNITFTGYISFDVLSALVRRE